MPHWYLHHYSISFHVRHYTSLFLFCFMVSCFICRNLTLPKRPCLLEMFFLSNEINFCCHEISFFTLNCFPKPKLTKSLLVLIKYFSVIPYFEKLLSSHRYLFDKSFYIDVYRAWFILLLLLLLLYLMLLMSFLAKTQNFRKNRNNHHSSSPRGVALLYFCIAKLS